jgi:hypothetical protein
MTSSARCCRNKGTSRPSALAVLRLITSSYLVGACTGSSLGFSPLEDAIYIGRRSPKIIGQVNAVGQQAADLSEKTERIDGRETVASRQRCDLYAIGNREGIRDHDQAAIQLASLCSNDKYRARTCREQVLQSPLLRSTLRRL